MGPSAKTQHAIRRSTRLPLEVPVLLTSLDPTGAYSAQCNTTLVNAHGCGLIVPHSIVQGTRVRLEIVSAKRHTTARVAEVVPLGGDPETWLVGLELDVPGNFWGIEYAPSDWKIEESPVPAAPARTAGPALKAAEKPVRSRRWRLTDISAGACYLETAEPIPLNAAVVMSIRALNVECLLDGVVRVSHDQMGIGIEFDQSSGQNQRAKVEELIARLTSNREVPKIFVGRREVAKKEVKVGLTPAPVSSPETLAGDEPSDPLLELIRQGASLSVEQFQNDLRAQRLGKRRDLRIDVALPVSLSGTDVTGRPLDQQVTTLNISRRGALLVGIHGMLEPGAQVALARVHKREFFRVAWAGAQDTPKAGQIGVAAVDPNSSFWDEVLKAMVGPELETAGLHRGQTAPGD